MSTTVKDLFKGFSYFENEVKITFEIDNNYTISELISIFISNELYKTYFVKLWALPEEAENRFYVKIMYNNEYQRFEFAYRYPLDKKKVKNYFTSLVANDFRYLPSKDVTISKIEFYHQKAVNWDFIYSNHKHPQFDFIIGSITNDYRFCKSGYSTTESETHKTLSISSSENQIIRCIFEYNKENNEFNLSVTDKSISFYCSFNDKWSFCVDDKYYNDISEILRMVGQ